MRKTITVAAAMLAACMLAGAVGAQGRTEFKAPSKKHMDKLELAMLAHNRTHVGNVCVTNLDPKGPGFFPHEKRFLIPAAYAARSAGQPRKSSG